MKITQHFKTADEAIAWYNGWLKVTDPPDDAGDCRMCSEHFGGWDPVIKWFTKDGKGVYWYIVPTGGTESLVIEGEDTIRDWGNRYYFFTVENEGKAAADAVGDLAELPEMPPPGDLKPSTPEAKYWAPQLR